MVRGFRNRAQPLLPVLGGHIHAVVFEHWALPGGSGVVSRNGLGCPDPAADSAVVRLAVRGALPRADALADWLVACRRWRPGPVFAGILPPNHIKRNATCSVGSQRQPLPVVGGIICSVR